MNSKNSHLINGVHYLSPKSDQFSNTYLQVREKENRVHSDDVVSKLPNIDRSNQHFYEWSMRQKSTDRIHEYLSKKNQPLRILDLGCGNGWFTNLLASIPETEVLGVDVNDLELEQAARVFKRENLQFMYADIFSPEAESLKEFDIITINSCIQYFDDFGRITELLYTKLKKGGELHIIDSPFYKQEDVSAAGERTQKYFESLGHPEMAENYFHHSWSEVIGFNSLYNPKKSRIKKLLGVKDTPFHWLCKQKM